MRAGAPAAVRRRLPAALASLAASGWPGRTLIVDDGSADVEHLRFLEQLRTDPRYLLVRRLQNGGTSRNKNTALRACQQLGFALAFLAEDDIQFKQPGWWSFYEDGHRRTGIDHFSWVWPQYRPSGRYQVAKETYRGVALQRVNRLNGVFLTFSPAALEKAGGFRTFPTPWGGGHHDYTCRAVQLGLTPGFVDLAGSGEYLGLNEFAAASVTTAADRRQYARILARVPKNTTLKYPLEE